MITKDDLQEAIAECQGVRNPNANTCIKLASYYTILDHTEDYGHISNEYSYAAGDETIKYSSHTSFAQKINGMSASAVWPLIDELMDTLEVAYPKIYNYVMQELEKKERG